MEFTEMRSTSDPQVGIRFLGKTAQNEVGRKEVVSKWERFTHKMEDSW